MEEKGVRHFRDPRVQDFYEKLVLCPPTRFVPHKQATYRLYGSSHRQAFWIGFDGGMGFAKGSTCYYAWLAGQDYRALGGKDYPRP